MASALNTVSLMNVNTTRLVDDFYDNWPKYYSYFEYNTIEKVKWFGDLDCSKEFAQNLFGNDGKWCSTRGSAKSFQLHQTSITWYTDTNSLTFHGEGGNFLKDLIAKSCKNGCVANPQKCHDCSRLSAEITEVNQQVDELYHTIDNLYLPTSYGSFSIFNTREKTCDVGINADLKMISISRKRVVCYQFTLRVLNYTLLSLSREGINKITEMIKKSSWA